MRNRRPLNGKRAAPMNEAQRDRPGMDTMVHLTKDLGRARVVLSREIGVRRGPIWGDVVPCVVGAKTRIQTAIYSGRGGFSCDIPRCPTDRLMCGLDDLVTF